ncbi:D-2-hydroxyacid dehydrogenase [Diplocloster agilis]|uniref:D-2-hydroxyacid dehydrogenase n=1 Tax=Diplocloster agilis TaxID=2850323 RepID=A0A949JZ05_9FIRM|nr:MULTISPECIES: D-2-hydroxyacid dehydrogenase [Lachnospiraceae]MBU9737828.1 D-2-hydroxyacid dehydrogenase [Diplocloster agilis]MCU6736653.1 D-2-hydroxyacid dehydrogenase [Suonthocola fibrivorans]SCJ92545.1 Glycerate dehydrogenase [uncultured Clostridium sp.]
MKIVVLDGYTENPGDLTWEGLERLGELTVYERTPHDDSVIQSRIGDAGLIFTNKTPLSAATIRSAKNLRYIGVLATGYNVVDIRAAKEQQIVVSNIPSYGTAAVAQFAIGLLLEICHHIGYHSDVVHQGKWEACPDWCFWDYPLIELDGKTMGIIGFGRIGQQTARLAAALGMKILAYDSYQDSALSGKGVRYVTLEELLGKSDVISLHCPLFPDTEGIINRDTIAKMKDGVIILNNSRGQLVVEEDLAEALISGKVGAAGLDVVSTEPIRRENPLLKAPNCIITPHISWASRESRQRLMDLAVENAAAFLDGRPQNVVNL